MIEDLMRPSRLANSRPLGAAREGGEWLPRTTPSTKATASVRFLQIRPSFRAISAGHGGGRDLKDIGFRQRKAVCEELRKCDGFETDGGWGLCNRRDKTSFKGYMALNFAAICDLEMPLF